MNRLIGLVILISTMSLFNFSEDLKGNNPEPNPMILGMILLEKPNSLDFKGMTSDLEENWGLKIDSNESEKETAVLSINGYTIAIAVVPAPIPGDEVETTVEFNYLWPDGANEATKHKGHVILSIMNAGKDPIKENILFNQMAASILKNSESIGIYIGARTLVLKKDFYLYNSESMSEENLPLYNWIYFGLIQDKGKQSAYTYGLADFGKKEMEIVRSKKDAEELNEMMYSLTHYVLAYDVTLKAGETIGMSAEQKLKISESKGEFLDGTTIKIDY